MSQNARAEVAADGGTEITIGLNAEHRERLTAGGMFAYTVQGVPAGEVKVSILFPDAGSAAGEESTS